MVVVVTVGKGFGTVTYNLGQKVRNSDLKHLTWTYERELLKLQEKFDWVGVAPVLPEEAEARVVGFSRRIRRRRRCTPAAAAARTPSWSASWGRSEGFEAILAWAELIDKYVQKIRVDREAGEDDPAHHGRGVEPAGGVVAAAASPGRRRRGPRPERPRRRDFPDRALVKGAAVGAHIELGRRAAAEILRAAVTETVTGSPKPREIFEKDLLWAFKRMDRDADGMLSHDDLHAGVKLMGTSFSDAEVTGLLRDFTGGLEKAATPAQFCAWFERMVELASSKVREVHSEEELMRTLEEAQERPSIVTGEVEAGGSLVVLECAYTHCRPCMQFVRQYEGVADKYLDTVFLRVIGDECPGAAHLCRDVLHVGGNPEFRFYAEGGPAAQNERREQGETGGERAIVPPRRRVRRDERAARGGGVHFAEEGTLNVPR